MWNPEFHIPLESLRKPKLRGMLPMRWYPDKFSQMLGIPIRHDRVGGRYIRKDVAAELMKNPLRFLHLKSEALLRQWHPEFSEFYEEIGISNATVPIRHNGYAGMEDHIIHLCGSEIRIAVEIDSWKLFRPMLELVHSNALQPLLRDTIHKDDPLYRRDIIHLLVSPNVKRSTKKMIMHGPFMLQKVCESEGIYEEYKGTFDNTRFR